MVGEIISEVFDKCNEISPAKLGPIWACLDGQADTRGAGGATILIVTQAGRVGSRLRQSLSGHRRGGGLPPRARQNAVGSAQSSGTFFHDIRKVTRS